MAEQFDVVVIGGGPGRLRRRAVRRGRGPQGRRGREGQGRRHLPAPRAASRPRSSSRRRRVPHRRAAPRSSACTPSSRRIDFAVSQARKQKVVDQLWKGLSGPAEEAQDHRRQRHRRARTEQHGQGRRRHRAQGRARRSWPPGRCRAPFPASTSTASSCSRPTRCSRWTSCPHGGRSSAAAPSAASSRRRWPTSACRSRSSRPAQDPPRLRQGRRRRRRQARSRSAASTCAPASRSRATRPTRQRHDRVASATASRSRRRGRRVGRAPPAVATASSPTAPASKSTSAASSRSTSRMRTRRDGVYAVGDLVDTPAARPRRLRRGDRRDQGHPRRGPGARRLRQGAVVHLLLPRGRRSPGSPRRRPRRRASTSSSRSISFAGNGRALIVGETEGLVKVDRREAAPTARAGRILGVHMVGPWVTEQLGQGYLAVNWEATRRRDRAVHPAPPDAVRDVRRGGDGPHRERTARLMADITMPQLGETVTEGTITRGPSRSATRSPRTRSSSRSRPTRSTPRSRRRRPAT